MESKQYTYWHLPESPQHTPGKQSRERYGGSSEGYTVLPVGTTVSLHSVQGIYKVTRHHFHVGQPDEQEGLHVFLERVDSQATIDKGFFVLTPTEQQP